MDKNHDLILDLLRCEVVRIGNIKLKTGAFSPIYIDLRRIIHYPAVVKNLADAVRQKQLELKLECDTVCGVPYTALPVASVYSVLFDIPMVMKRKEAKDYGTKKMVEGNFKAGDTCLIIEDIVSSGTSIVETVEVLRKEGLTVQNCIVVIDRKQGGLENAKKIGVNVYPLFDIETIVSVYSSIHKVEKEVLQQIKTYFKDNSYIPVFKPDLNAKCSYAERARSCNHPVSKRLFLLMEEKKTNLCVAVDTNNSSELLRLAEMLGPYICVLKTHVDILEDFSEDVVTRLSELASKNDFLIFEDRKFADIGNTVLHQYKNGIYKIHQWADLVTVHGIPGDGIIEALKTCGNNEKRACILVAEMSSKGALTNEDYKDSVFKMAKSHPDFVIGYVSQNRNPNSKELIHMCPGVNMESSGDSLGQQYKSPEIAINNGADIIIVGRGICKASDVVTSAVQYRDKGFEAYLKRIK